MITLSNRNCIIFRNRAPSYVYIRQLVWVSILRNACTCKRSHLLLLSFLYCLIFANDASLSFWVIRDSWSAIKNPPVNTMAPTVIASKMSLWSCSVLCMQFKLANTPKNMKLPEQTCRAMDDKNIPHCSVMIFDKTWKVWYSRQLIRISVENQSKHNKIN